MVRFFKNNWLYLLSITILVFWFLISLNNFMNDYNSEKNFTENIYNKCENKELSIEECEGIEEQLESIKIPPAPLLHNYVLMGGSYSIELLQIVSILFVAMPSIWSFYQDSKSGIYKNKLVREKYSNFIWKHYKKSLKGVFILPIFILITFLITCFISGFKFQYSPGEIELGGDVFWSSGNYLRALWIPYFSTMIICLLMHSIYYINTAYLFFYKAKNFIINIVGVYLCYLLTQTVVVSILGRIFGKHLKMWEFSLALSDSEIWIFGSEIKHYEYMILTSIIYILISSLLVFLLYRKKERYVISNEG